MYTTGSDEVPFESPSRTEVGQHEENVGKIEGSLGWD